MSPRAGAPALTAEGSRQASADLLVGWLPEAGSRANPARALAFALLARLGPLTAAELRELVEEWTGERPKARTVRRHLEALLRRGLVARMGEDRWTVPGDVAARAWKDGVRLRWLASAATWRATNGDRLGVADQYVLAFRDQRSSPRREGPAWVDSVQLTAERLGVHVRTVRQVEKRLRELDVLAVGAHSLGKRWRPTAGGPGRFSRSRLVQGCQYGSQAEGCPNSNSDAVDEAGARESSSHVDESVVSRLLARSARGRGASLRSASLRGTREGVRTPWAPAVPDWLVDLERRAVAAHREDLADPTAGARLRLLRRLNPLLLRSDPRTAALVVLTAAGAYVDLRGGDTGPGLRERRTRLAAQLSVDARRSAQPDWITPLVAHSMLAWCLSALRRYGQRGERIVGRKDGKPVLEIRAGVENLGGYVVRALGQRDPRDALDVLLKRETRRLLGRDGTWEDLLPARIREDLLPPIAEMRRDVLTELAGDIEKRPRRVVSRADMLGEAFRRAGRRGDQDGALRAIGAAVAEGLEQSEIVQWASGMDLRVVRVLVAEATSRGYCTPEAAAELQVAGDIPQSIAARMRLEARRADERGRASAVGKRVRGGTGINWREIRWRIG